MVLGVSAADKQARQSAFLSAYSLTGIVGPAAEAAGIARGTVSDWRSASPDFSAAMDVAYQAAADRLEAEALRRASEGTRKPIIYRGKQIRLRNPDTGRLEPAWEHHYSDALMGRLLTAYKPDKYHPENETRHTSVSVSLSGPLPSWFGTRPAVTADHGADQAALLPPSNHGNAARRIESTVLHSAANLSTDALEQLIASTERATTDEKK